jgi:hypothetical protein
VPWVTLGVLAALHFSQLVLLSTMLVPRVIYLSCQKHMGRPPHVSDAGARGRRMKSKCGDVDGVNGCHG